MIRDKLRSETALIACASLRGSDGIGKLARLLGALRPCGRPIAGSRQESGGQSGIRTHGELSPTAVFKTAALNHSAICPGMGLVGLGGSGQVTLWGRTLRNSDGGRP